MKSLFMTIITAFAITASAVTYDEAVRLADTPIDQVTAENASAILDASIAVTNLNGITRVVSKKILPMSEFIEKLGSDIIYINHLKFIVRMGTKEEQLAAIEPILDTWIRASDEDKIKFNNVIVELGRIHDGDKSINAYKSDPDLLIRLCDKLVNSGVRYAMNGVVNISCTYGGYSVNKDVIGRYVTPIITAIKNDDYYPNRQILEFAMYLNNAGDYNTLREFITDIKWYKPYCKCNSLLFLGFEYTKIDLSSTRRKFLNEVAESDGAFITVAKAQDKIDGNKLTTLSIYNKLTKADNKVKVAVYLDNADLLIDALMTVDSSVTPENMNDAIRVLNSLDPDYRSEDVKKALRVINKKYTIKLYDDRATWEPIISKVRALIDVY